MTADLHFIFQVLVCRTFALGTVEKPAEVAGLKFPGWAVFFVFAFFVVPAVFPFGRFPLALIDQQEIDLSLNMERYGSPPLLIALDSL